MVRLAGLLILVLLSIGVTSGLDFAPRAHADHGELTVSIASVDDSEYPTVRAVINVDHGGSPLQDLPADQIVATESGATAVISSLEPVIDADLPIALVLVIDISGSVSGELIAEVQAAAIKLVEQLGPADSAAVISFADQVTVAQELTTDHSAVVEAIEGLTAFGNTALFDAVGAASKLATLALVPRSAVVLLSDGAEYGGFSAATRESSLTDIEGGAPFYVIGVGQWVDLAYLEEVAGRSGGRYFAAGTVSEIEGVYGTIEELLRSQYVVTLEVAEEAAATAGELTIVVTVGQQSATASKSYVSRRAIDQLSVATPAAQPAPTSAVVESSAVTPVQAPAEAAGNSSLLLPLIALAVLSITAIAAVLIRRRQTQTRVSVVPPSAVDRRPLRAVTVERAAAQSGYLVPLTVAGVESEVPLGEGPITIGTAEDCRARVETCSGVAAQHARIWQRDGRPMLHHVAAGYQTQVNGGSIEWAALNHGDEIAIGPYRFRFVSQLQSEPATPREASA
ncbi:MAG: VWA domain-containing protein [Dehalococcoidia bacterium]|nr:VWA domain-containing protein [Dehalococcoidia bacterium]